MNDQDSKLLVQDSRECLAGRSLRSWPRLWTDSAWWPTIIPVVQSKWQGSEAKAPSARAMAPSLTPAVVPQAGPQRPPALGERLRSPACTNCSVEAEDPAGTQSVRPGFCSPGGGAYPGREVRLQLSRWRPLQLNCVRDRERTSALLTQFPYRYIEILREHRPKHTWDEYSGEHFISFKR